VFEEQIAQSIAAGQEGGEIDGLLGIQVTAKPGRTLEAMRAAADSVLQGVLEQGVTEREIQTAVNNKEAQLVNRLATALGKAGGLATFHTLAGDARLFSRELDRYQGITSAEVAGAARTVCRRHRVALSVVPKGKRDLALSPAPERRA
jgi:predicted Zn-dependent peptidase